MSESLAKPRRGVNAKRTALPEDKGAKFGRTEPSLLGQIVDQIRVLVRPVGTGDVDAAVRVRADKTKVGKQHHILLRPEAEGGQRDGGFNRVGAITNAHFQGGRVCEKPMIDLSGR